MIDYYHPNINLTLLGCGFLGFYSIGAIYLLHQIWPQRPYNKICGASCGGLLGALFIAGLSVELVLRSYIDIIRRCTFLKNPSTLTAIGDLVEACMKKLLPKDAHKLCTDRLGVSVTKLWSFENRLISRFESRQELIDALAAGCFIPVWAGLSMPRYKGELHIDGACSNNEPEFALTNEDIQTGVRWVSVTPFATRNATVSPKDAFFGTVRFLGTNYRLCWKNLAKARLAMIPSKVDLYRPHLVAGHRDMKEYILNEDMVFCQQCYRDQVRAATDNAAATSVDYHQAALGLTYRRKVACLSCLQLLERVDSLEISQEMLQTFD